ncbi:hypothetical protein Clacol_003837 [Clathrus columnatus]|uniref:Atos-like conserved domain-containing protein n=1 Tax=Clathrus columnatus TaxID=1419009 RepID=A0AAV5A4R4_9AGAM|nr:hypothetical protein Clacol_003837 [Clathrus columnatus]
MPPFSPFSGRGLSPHDSMQRTTNPSPLARELNIEALRLTPIETSSLTPDDPNAHNASGPSSGASSPSLSRSSSSRRRRRFSHRTSDDISAATSPIVSPLFGSYKHSLLSGRMSGPGSPPSLFTLTLSIKSLPPFRNFFVPPKVHIPFQACFYDLSGPWVGSVDLDDAPQLQTKMFLAEGGYRVPPKGQVQLVIKNQLGTVMKVLVLPYDLTDMPLGTQAPIRRLWYGEATNDPHQSDPSPQQDKDKDDDKDKDKDKEDQPIKEVIRYAVHLKFVCPPARSSSQRPRAHSAGQTSAHRSTFSKFGMTSISSNIEPDTVESDEGEISSHSANEGFLGLGTSRRKFTRSSSMTATDPRKIFLAGELRLVFASRIPDEEEMVRAENDEGHDKYYDWEPVNASDT